MAAADHAFRFVAGADPASPPLVLLHGTGGSETDLLAFASWIAPGSALLGVRGTVEIGGGYAFFRRFPDRRVDEADLAARIPALAAFVDTSLRDHGVSERPVAVGFSNGAIMATALLLARPDSLAGAILLRPLSPFADKTGHQIGGRPVLILDGEHDERRSPGDGLRVADLLSGAGARVTHHVLPVGHALTDADAQIARDWLRDRRGDEAAQPDS